MNAIVLMVLPAMFGGDDRIEGWPHSYVPQPANMKVYTKSRHAQSVYILNGNNTHEWVRSDVRHAEDIFPWTTSGGLANARFTSKGAIAFPEGEKLVVWVEFIDAQAGRPLPKYRWNYPEGTIVADMLFNEKGELFELRTLTKKDGQWQPQRKYRDEAKFPVGYKGMGTDGAFDTGIGTRRNCLDCHSYAGAWASYGSNIPGSDGIFSFNPFKEGTSVLKSDWPVEFRWAQNEYITPPPDYWRKTPQYERMKVQKFSP